MGSRKKAKGKKKSSSKPSDQKSRKLLRTAFMDDFERLFIFDASLSGAARMLWPSPGMLPDQMFQDFADVMQVLSARMTGQTPALNGPAASPPLRDRVITHLSTLDWPTKSPIPAAFKKKGRGKTVHLCEIAVISDRMLQAINSGGHGGGGGSPWPPHIR